MTSTKPPGDRTGHSLPGCYAAALADCKGALEAEHYISRAVLQQLGKFTIQGPHWAQVPTSTSAERLKAHVLCARHNRALSPVDAAAGKFYSLILRAVNGEDVGDHEFDGEDLERWAIKLMLGVAASGNAPGGLKTTAAAPSLESIQMLFGEREMNEKCGFQYLGRQPPGMEAMTSLAWQLGEGPEPGTFDSVTIKLVGGFTFLTTLTAPGHVHYRPTGFVLGVPREQGHIKLRWSDRPYSGSLILMFSRPATTAGGR